MTYSNFAIDAALLSVQGCATWSYLLAGSAPYVCLPIRFTNNSFVYHSINSQNRRTISITGHGGFLQVFTHGLTGFRFRNDVFYLNPSLPPQLGPDGVIVKGMKWQGAVFDVQVALENTTITRQPGSADTNGQNVTVQVSISARLIADVDLHCECNGRNIPTCCERDFNHPDTKTRSQRHCRGRQPRPM